MRSEPVRPLSPNGSGPLAIDGHAPRFVVEPESPAELARFLADAAADELAVSPLGGQTSLALGNRPERLDAAVSTARLTGVLDYVPTDLTLSVAAGMPFAELQALLAEHGQTLPVEAPRADRATVGGLIATAIAGPRRYGAGTLRDLLIGISAAHPSGTVTKAGGMVVKNVTGFDLMRLYLGSLGTLGVVVSANFKVLPLPRAEATLLANADSVGDAFAAAWRLRASRVGPVALEVTRAAGRWRLAARIEGRERTVKLLAAEARELAALDASLLESEESAAWWRAYLDAQAVVTSGNDALIRCLTEPSTIALVLGQLIDAAERERFTLDGIAVSPGLGSIVARLSNGTDAGGSAPDRFAALCGGLRSARVATVALAAPPAWKADLDVWGEPPEAIDLMRSIKHEFDPTRVLNPGRFAGGI